VATALADLRAKLNGELGVTSDSETAPWPQAVRNNAIRDGYAVLWRQGVWRPAKVDVTTTSVGRIYAVTGIRRLMRAELLDTDGYLVQKLRAIIEPDGEGGYELIVPEQSEGYTIRLYGWTAYTSALPDADPDRFVTSTSMKVGSYTLAATTQSDGVARPVVVTVTKVVENDTMGTLALVGTDASGAALSETLTLNNGDTAGGITTSTGSFLTLTSATGAGWASGGTADTIKVGTGDPVDDLDSEHNRVPLLKAKAICLRVAASTFARYGERQALPPEMNTSVDQLLGLVAAAEREFEVECKSLAGLRLRGGGPMAVP
jgi:hypothetical protein